MNRKINFTLYYDGVHHEQTADMMTVREHCLLAYRCAALAGTLTYQETNMMEPYEIAEMADGIAQSMLELDEEDKES